MPHSVRTRGRQAGGLDLGRPPCRPRRARRTGRRARGCACRRRLDDVRVGLQAELLDLLARLARGCGVGEGADLDDEAAAARRLRRRPCLRAGPCAARRLRSRPRRFGRGVVGVGAVGSGLPAPAAARVRLGARPALGGALGAGAARSRRRCRSRPAARAATSRPARRCGSVTTRLVAGAARDAAGATRRVARRRHRQRRRLSLRGISIGMSTGIGRGCVSNSSGKPMTPTPTSTAAPIRRCRARVRACCTASPASAGGARGRWIALEERQQTHAMRVRRSAAATASRRRACRAGCSAAGVGPAAGAGRPSARHPR